MCYEGDKGPKIAFGEIKLSVVEMINRCHFSPNETFEGFFPLYKPGTRKPALSGQPKGEGPAREAGISLRFTFATKGSKQPGGPRAMAEAVMQVYFLPSNGKTALFFRLHQEMDRDNFI